MANQMIRVKDMITILEEVAPFSIQEDYDNSGLQLGNPEKEVKRVLVCLDVTPDVVNEAVALECDLIISHHPILFKGIKRLTGEHYAEQVIIEAIKKDIGILAVHTNLDNVYSGVNHKLASILGLQHLKVLLPAIDRLKKLVTFCPVKHVETLRTGLFEVGAGTIGDYDSCSYNVEGYGTFRAGEKSNPFVGKTNELHIEPEVRVETIFPDYLEKDVIRALITHHPYEEVAYDIYRLDNVFDKVGTGLVGVFEKSIDEEVFLDLIKNKLNIPCLRHSPLTGKKIKKLALCGGAGSFLLNKAVASGLDAFITSEVKYNQFMDASGHLLLVDAGHYETEQFTKELIAEIIQKKLINFAVLISKVNTNPVCYY
jgi:dinuclear metal center YbgI/SA1388 family protein